MNCRELHSWNVGRYRPLSALLAVAALVLMPVSAAQGWEPTKPVQFVIPAGTGGGAYQMARFIQGVVAKNNLAKQPLITVNKGGGADAEGFLEVKKSTGDHQPALLIRNATVVQRQVE